MNTLTILRRALLAVACCATVCLAQSSADGANRLLDHLAGDWVLHGTIDGRESTHDVHAEWVLNREYIHLHEVSRDKGRDGKIYEAIVYLAWHAKRNEYTCMWLDSTGGGGLAPEGIALGKESGNVIPLVFTLPRDESLHTTFTYNEKNDTWSFTIDDVTKDKSERFANMTLTRRK